MAEFSKRLAPSACALFSLVPHVFFSDDLFAESVLRAQPSGWRDKLEFNRHIRPILSENCFPCHGPDKNQRKAKLRLDDREVALAKEAFKPGKPDESELVRRIYTTKQDDLMPPPDSTKRLTPPQKEILKRWIAQGAEYEPHWAYIKPVRPKIPATKNPAWVQNPIDAFVLHDLEEKNLQPSPSADKHTLIRRLSLDLTGLPPTPFEVREFVEDSSPAAYENLVDRLLASPHYGERMAVPWLDLARFTDTVGYHGDQNERIFPYRDYVIESFNRNKPFDQFTIEQLAGDLLPQPTTEQIVATGFNFGFEHDDPRGVARNRKNISPSTQPTGCARSRPPGSARPWAAANATTINSTRFGPGIFIRWRPFSRTSSNGAFTMITPTHRIQN